MQLTQAQKTALKAHMAANTNTTPSTGADGQTFVINTRLSGRDPTDENAIAAWYNGAALAGDAQPFAILLLWNPRVTMAQLNNAIDWSAAPAGADQPTVTNGWLKWQSMIWAGQGFGGVALDMTDPQVRAGVLSVWGAGSTSAVNIGLAAASGNNQLCGKLTGRRVDLALSPAPVGAVGGTWAGAHVCPANVLGQTLSQSDVDDVLANG